MIGVPNLVPSCSSCSLGMSTSSPELVVLLEVPLLLELGYLTGKGAVSLGGTMLTLFPVEEGNCC